VIKRPAMESEPCALTEEGNMGSVPLFPHEMGCLSLPSQARVPGGERSLVKSHILLTESGIIPDYCMRSQGLADASQADGNQKGR
jgi:hypothetical protein